MNRHSVLLFKAERFTYRKRLELGLVIALSLLLALVCVVPRRLANPEVDTIYIDFDIENVEIPPPTRQHARIAPPHLPQLPIPTEDEWLPDEATIDESTLDLAFLDLPEPPSELPYDGRRVVFRAKKKEKHTERRRTNKDIILALLVDINGQVDSLYVVKNPSGDEDVLAEAIRTAYRTRFVDDRPKKNKTFHWIRRKF